MAEKEQKAEKESKAEKEESGAAKKSPKMLIIIVVAVALAGAGGYFFMSKSSHKEEVPAAAEDDGGGHGEAKGGHGESSSKGAHGTLLHPLDTFIVNLANQNRTMYLKVTIQLEVDKPEAVDEITAKNTKVRDSLIILLSSKSLEEIASTEGKYQLRDEIVSRVNQFMSKGMVTTAYFTDLVVQ